MKLSQAIRLGAMMRPQGRAGLLVNGKTCALGAACEAVGIVIGEVGTHSRIYSDLRERWPLLTLSGPHSNCMGANDIMQAIWMMNDICCHTREQIADWVESIESIEEGKNVATVLHATREARA